MRKGLVAAVCVVLLLSFVALCACETDIVEEDAELVELTTWRFTSGVPNNLIEVKHSDPNAKFQLTADKGEFYEGGGEWSQTVMRNNGELATWQSTWEVELAYVDVVVKVDDNIVGYVVIKIMQDEVYIADYHAEVVKSVAFPKVDGQYQKISQKQVDKKIQAAKD